MAPCYKYRFDACILLITFNTYNLTYPLTSPQFQGYYGKMVSRAMGSERKENEQTQAQAAAKVQGPQSNQLPSGASGKSFRGPVDPSVHRGYGYDPHSEVQRRQ